jgi:hypothetical protein
MKPNQTYAEWLIMMEYDHQCQLDPTIPLKYPCSRYSIHLATLVIINLCPVIVSQSGDITIDPWHSTTHVLHCFILLNIMDNSHFSIFVGTISVLMISLTTPTLNGSLSWPLFPYFSHSRFSKRWLSLRNVFEKGRFVSLLPLLFLELPLVIPSLPKGRLFSLLLI